MLTSCESRLLAASALLPLEDSLEKTNGLAQFCPRTITQPLLGASLSQQKAGHAGFEKEK